MTPSRLFPAALLFLVLAGPRLAHAEKVAPNPSTLEAVKQKRILILDDKTWNTFHEVPKQASLEIFQAFNTLIGWTAFSVVESAPAVTLDTLNNYDVVIFNYCDNLSKAAGTPFATALQQWFATGNKGYIGYHTSAIGGYGPPTNGGWPFYDDSVTSTRNIKPTAAHTQGTLAMKMDDSLTQAPIL